MFQFHCRRSLSSSVNNTDNYIIFIFENSFMSYHSPRVEPMRKPPRTHCYVKIKDNDFSSSEAKRKIISTSTADVDYEEKESN